MFRYFSVSLFTFTVFALLASCGTAQRVFYSYKVDGYYMGGQYDNKRFSNSHVISCGDYMVEFNVKTNFNDTAIAHKGEINLVGSGVTFDTLSVYLLTPNWQYVEFDTFSLNAKVLGKGGLSEKPFGVKPQRPKPADKASDTTSKKPTYSPLADTVINNIPCYYADQVRGKNDVQDTVGLRVYLVKNKQLNSIYKLLGGKWPNTEYCMVGLQPFFYENGAVYTERIANLRPLTTTERNICESLIRKAGLPLPR
jgi:hypothetical protein